MLVRCTVKGGVLDAVELINQRGVSRTVLGIYPNIDHTLTNIVWNFTDYPAYLWFCHRMEDMVGEPVPTSEFFK